MLSTLQSKRKLGRNRRNYRMQMRGGDLKMQSWTGPTLGLDGEESLPQTGSDFYYAIISGRYSPQLSHFDRSTDRSRALLATLFFLHLPLSRIRIQHAISRLDEADGRFGDIY